MGSFLLAPPTFDCIKQENPFFHTKPTHTFALYTLGKTPTKNKNFLHIYFSCLWPKKANGFLTPKYYEVCNVYFANPYLIFQTYFFLLFQQKSKVCVRQIPTITQTWNNHLERIMNTNLISLLHMRNLVL